MAQEQITGETSTPPVGQEQAAGQSQDTAASQEVKQVPLSALEEERRMRQESQREAEILRKRAMFLEQASAQQQQPKFDPDDIPSFKDVVGLLNERDGRIIADSRQTKLQLQLSQAKQTNSDFDEVYQLGLKVLEENDPDLAEGIMEKSANPVMAVYRLGLTHPSHAEKTRQRVTQELTEKINGNLNRQQTLSNAGGGGTPSPEVNWREKAGTKELRDRIAKVKGYQR